MMKRIFSVDHDHISWKKALSVALSVVMVLSLGNLMAFAEAGPIQEVPPLAAVSETDASAEVSQSSDTTGADADQPAGQNTPADPGVSIAPEAVGAPGGKPDTGEAPAANRDFEDGDVAVTTDDILYQVTHSFASGTPGYPDLPYGVMSMLPGMFMAPAETVFPSPASPALGTKYADDDTGLVWKLMRWTPGSVDIDGVTVTSAHFTGIWEVTSLIDYPVTYAFVSGTDRYPALPSDIINMLPAATTAHPGTVSAPAAPALGAQFDDGAVGVWEFRGWEPGSVTLDGDAVTSAHFKGTWEVVNYKTYTVSHRFASQKPGQILPPAVLGVCPGSYQVRYDEPVAPTYFIPQSVTMPEGTWKFAGWEPLSARSTTDVTFIGTWALDPNVFNIAYVLNGGTNDPGNPTTYTSESPDITLAAATRDGYTFQGWSIDSSLQTPATVPAIPTGSTGDRNFFAKWDANIYVVSHAFVSGTGGAILPAEVQALAPASFSAKHGDTVRPAALAKRTHRTAGGLWTFSAWDAPAKLVNAAGVTFTGTWTYMPDPVLPAPLPTTGAPTPTPTPTPTPSPKAPESDPEPAAELEISDDASPMAAPDPDYGILWFVGLGTVAVAAVGIGGTVLWRRFAHALGEAGKGPGRRL